MPHKTSIVFLSVLLIILLFFVWQMAQPFLSSFILASVLAIVISPLEEWLARLVKRRGLATFITTLLTVSVVGIISVLIGLVIIKELTVTYNALDLHSVEEGGWPALVTRTADRILDAVATRLPVNKEAIRTELLTRMKAASGYMLSSLVSAVGGVTTILITGLLVTLFLYFLLRSGKEWVRQLASLTPLESRTTDGIIRTVKDSVVANISGMVIAALGQGCCLALGFWFVGVRSPMLWGAIGGFASVIPILGAPLVWLPVVIAYLLMGFYWKALILVLWGSLVVGSVDNVLRPLVVGAREKQHPVLIALAAIGGTYAFGPLGFLLGPLLISLAAALLKEIQKLASPNAVVPDLPPPNVAGD